jgi:CheY-like chemotaxis protein
MSSFALERQVRIEVVRENTPLNADVDRVLQVLNNLLSNAVKFSSAATAVRIGVASLDGEARFFVHNHGRPIPADKLEMIFERFQQVDSSDSRNVGGTGLGLAICREIAEQHRGRVWAESGQDRGTTFWLALPMTPALDDGVRPAPGGGLIVACDGSPGGRAELKEMVESLGYGVLEARTGAAALDMARSERPTAIVLNLALPSAEAIETLGALAGDDAIADIPVLMIDGLGISVSTTVTTDGEGSSLEDLLHRFSLAALPEAAGRILVVEHDEARASRLLTRLEEDERWVHRARTAAEAVAMAKGIRPDLALVNIGLPSGDGFTVVDALVDGDLRPGALMVYSAARFVNPTPGAVETSALHADV